MLRELQLPWPPTNEGPDLITFINFYALTCIACELLDISINKRPNSTLDTEI